MSTARQLETASPPESAATLGGEGDERKPEDIQRMFDDIHGTYDFLNRLLTGGMDARWRRRVVRAVAPRSGDRVLDVCCGTADLALAFRDHDGLVVGSDFSTEMVHRGVSKIESRGARPRLLVGDTTSLPFADDSFDVVTVGFGIRNVPNLDRGIAEMVRVARPGARVAILEFTQSEKWSSQLLNRIYCGGVLPLVGRAVSGHRTAYKYLPNTIDRFPDRHALARRMEKAGLVDVRIETMNFDLVALHVGTLPPDRSSDASAEGGA